LTPNQTVSLLSSEIDPGIEGYLIAVAVDSNGCPFKFNSLIGNEFVKTDSGFRGGLVAESYKALQQITPCSFTDSVATLLFDGAFYEKMARVIAFDGLINTSYNDSIMMVINKIEGNMTAQLDPIRRLNGLLHNDKAEPYSFTLPGSRNQLKFMLTDSDLRLTPRYNSIIANGTGWLKLFTVDSETISGAIFTKGISGFTGARNITRLLLESTQITIPVYPPNCY
jgi:hypothetical protein